ncbi:MAG: hypothetical protein K0A89_12020 [ANME-2 cluster archaeon]|nr:hypothetical protein [ANME-2 cluster archaeon]
MTFVKVFGSNPRTRVYVRQEKVGAGHVFRLHELYILTAMTALHRHNIQRTQLPPQLTSTSTPATGSSTRNG